MTQHPTLTVFDTLDYSKQAQSHGFTAEQAEFQANQMAKFAKDIYTELATKSDLETLRVATKHDLKMLGDSLQHDMKEMEGRLEYKMQGLEERLEYKMQGLEERLEYKMTGLEERLSHDAKGQEQRLLHKLTVRLGGMFLSSVTILGVLGPMLHKMI